MVPVLLPVQLGQEIAACSLLGAAMGAVRAFFPVRGRAALVPDTLLSGTVLLGCQSYAAGYSAAGVLRWYMVLAAFGTALLTEGVLGVPVRAAGRLLAFVLGLPGRLLARFVLQPLRARRAVRKKARKLRRNAQRAAKKSKKNLPNQRPVLYNSNVSK